jgi:hypothetical protein
MTRDKSAIETRSKDLSPTHLHAASFAIRSQRSRRRASNAAEKEGLGASTTCSSDLTCSYRSEGYLVLHPPDLPSYFLYRLSYIFYQLAVRVRDTGTF